MDATFGGGGHAREILKYLKGGKLVAFDWDADAKKNIDALRHSRPDFVGSNLPEENLIFIGQNFSQIKSALTGLGIEKVDGILADLGVSSWQIDEPQRGFSFRFDAPLDMRMNAKQNKDAKQVVNEYDEKELQNIFFRYGELRNAKKIANRICTARKMKLIQTTIEWVKAIEDCVPKFQQNKFLAKVFQAIRIEVNDELENLKKLLRDGTDVLEKGGRFVIISYHSLEDRLVKDFFASGNFEGELKKDMYGNILRPLMPINRKPLIPGDDEIEKNNRARSAKLRVAEKV